MKNTVKSLLGGVLASGAMLAMQAQAHVQMIVPSDDMVKQAESRNLNLDLMFWHPFEDVGMNMAKPARFGVLNGGKKTDLLESLKAVKLKDVNGDKFDGYKASYQLKRPGDHIFYAEPQPYWEESEKFFLILYTKVIVNAFGMEEGWDKEIGFKTEIMPLTRPYGLYTGNVFQGVVKTKGKPAPFTEVKVEYYNQDGKHDVEADPMITQVVKADTNGVFTYAMPKAGWWTFAALNKDDRTMKHNGKDYPVEIGAVLWVKTHDME